MARFFIDRPIFAWVIALFIMVLGGVAIKQLPIAQYPTVAPPSIVISATPGLPSVSPAAMTRPPRMERFLAKCSRCCWAVALSSAAQKSWPAAVVGTSEALVLGVTGRVGVLDELSGPGAGELGRRVVSTA